MLWCRKHQECRARLDRCWDYKYREDGELPWPVCADCVYAENKDKEEGMMNTEKVMEVLRRVEWQDKGHVEPYCPICHGRKSTGHREDCKLAVLLGEGREAVVSKGKVAALEVVTGAARAYVARVESLESGHGEYDNLAEAVKIYELNEAASWRPC